MRNGNRRGSSAEARAEKESCIKSWDMDYWRLTGKKNGFFSRGKKENKIEA